MPLENVQVQACMVTLHRPPSLSRCSVIGLPLKVKYEQRAQREMRMSAGDLFADKIKWKFNFTPMRQNNKTALLRSRSL